jgi:hypothetical protein
MEIQKPILKNYTLSYVVFVSGLALFVVWFFGHYEPHYIFNDRCFRLFGCNIGFFGYDALIHLLSSIFEAVTIIWLMNKFNLFKYNIWKNITLIIFIVFLLAVAWELCELVSDQIRLHSTTLELIHSNFFDQPNRSDTIGDIAFSILGAGITTLLLRSYLYFRPKSAIPIL